jgi:hypothetical protein
MSIMKKLPRRRIASPAGSVGGGFQFWAITLLALLVIIAAANLYLDHFAPIPSEPAAEQAQIEEEAQKPEPSVTVTDIEPEQQEEISTPTPQPPSPSNVKVQVLNGCGVRGIAARVRGILRDRGFDVMSYGNADRQNYRQSKVIIRSEGTFGEQAAEVVARSLGISSEQIEKEIDASLGDINITVILGLDHRQLNL